MKTATEVTSELNVQPAVVNLFFLGSGQHRDQFSGRNERGNLIYELYLMCQKEQQSDGTPQFTHLIDGVGGKPKKLANNEPNPNPMAGQYVYVPDETVPGKGTKVVDKKHSDKAAYLLGNALGFGVDENLHEAIAYLEQLTKTGYPPKVVNLTGFSRGSYTAIIIANMLNHMYPDVEVNLCLFDPVAGPTLKGNPQATVIPSNVKKAIIFYQKHEEGLLFEAQSKNRITVADPLKTNVQYEVVAGGHNAATKYEKENTSHSHRLAVGITYDAFQNDFGVEFIDGAKPTLLYSTKDKEAKKRQLNHVELDEKDKTPEGQLLLFMGMKQHDKDYAKQAKSKFVKRDHITGSAEEYVRDAEFFYSQRHREVFKTVLPKTFSYRFEMNAGNFTREQIEMELQNLAKTNPELFSTLKPELKKMGFNEVKPDVFEAPAKPMGIYLVEQCQILNNRSLVKENDELDYLLWATTSAVNYAKIKTSTLRQAKIDNIADQLQNEINKVLKEEPSRDKQIKKVEDAIRNATNRLQLEVGSCKLLSQLNGILNDPVSYANEAHNVINKYKNIGTATTNAVAKQIQKDIAHIVNDKKLSNMEKNQQIDAKLHLLQKSFEPTMTIDTLKIIKEIQQLRSFRKTQPQLLERMANRMDSFLFKNNIKRILTEIKSFFVKVPPDEKYAFEIKATIVKSMQHKLLVMRATGEPVTKEKLSELFSTNLKEAKSSLKNSSNLEDVIMKCYREIAPLRSEKVEAKKDAPELQAGQEPKPEASNISLKH